MYQSDSGRVWGYFGRGSGHFGDVCAHFGRVCGTPLHVFAHCGGVWVHFGDASKSLGRGSKSLRHQLDSPGCRSVSLHHPPDPPGRAPGSNAPLRDSPAGARLWPHFRNKLCRLLPGSARFWIRTP